ncbi:hypothetical protein RclHR1_02480007 [Rhizophagus clarus]|uniref:Kinase-like domain-containing protein n=1 Tax=Rhizophagus clarus TaxID=94130 RepID=A0A2Z6RT43_9GLOM|nr:hypothetical protein RclHR1_02480007 [Rhizophagus clarus]GET02854.1 kinase-like domain-containing protein [Rhizophagus clarus]
MTSWINSAIANGHFQLYSYNEFHHIRYNGEGRFSRVASADWPLTNRKVALKKLKNFNIEKFVSEVQMHTTCHSNKNIVRFLGLTKEESEASYIMIFEYADRNNLRMFLQKNANLKWDIKLKLSLDISKGLLHLHSLNVAHRDLKSNDIVINQDHYGYIAKITDFSRAKMLSDDRNDNDTDRVIGPIPFTDPKCLNDPKHYRKDLRSDIYSLGVILWEISSGRVPFESFMPDSRGEFRDLCLTFEIIGGLRERHVPHTPEGYVKLYKRCYDNEPDERPDIETVIEVLKTISSRLSRSLEQAMVTANNIVITK